MIIQTLIIFSIIIIIIRIIVTKRTILQKTNKYLKKDLILEVNNFVLIVKYNKNTTFFE